MAATGNFTPDLAYITASRRAQATGMILVALLVWFGATAAPAQALGSCGKGGPQGKQLMTAFEGSVYYITTPAGYDESRPWPIIFGLHGDEGDPAQSVNWNWRDLPDERFIFVAPKASNSGGSWYMAIEQNTTFMDALLDHLLAQYNIDLDRIAIWGLSGGAEFLGGYAMLRQDRFAAVQFNMGGGVWPYRQAGSPSPATCKIPARFVVSTTDFLRDGARQLYDTLTMKGHQTVWLDANCKDHCWDDVESGPNAREWLLMHTLCGMERPAGCQETPQQPDAGAPGPDAGVMPTDPPDAGNPPIGTAGMAGMAGNPPIGTAGMVGVPPMDAPVPPWMEPAPEGSASGCTVSANRPGLGWATCLWLLPLLALSRRRRNGMRFTV